MIFSQITTVIDQEVFFIPSQMIKSNKKRKYKGKKKKGKG